MKRLISIAAIGYGFYCLWTGAPIQENFAAIVLIAFGVIVELTVAAD